MKTVELHTIIDGQRVATDKLTREQALNVRIAADHLSEYLTTAYGLVTIKPKDLEDRIPKDSRETRSGW